MHNILTMKFGSHLYGTDTPNSDLDLKSVFIPGNVDMILGRVKDTIVTQTRINKAEGVRNTSDDVDNEQISLKQYLKLLCQGQPMALDMLFAPEAMIIERNDPFKIWKTLQNNKHHLLSKQSHSFIGYARQQANKYGIRGSRMDEAERVKNFLENLQHTKNKKVGDFSESLYKFVNDKEHCHIEKIMNPSGQEIEHFVCCNRKAPFTITVKEAYNIYKKLYDNYGTRARAAKNNEGIDWKACSHAIRVARQAIELAETGKIIFPLTYADHLVKVKTGQMDFLEVSAEITDLIDKVEAAFEKSSCLSEKPCQEWVDMFLYQTYRDYFLKNL